jgi:hypothetical protein
MRKDSIKMDVKARECEGVDWIHLAYDRVRWQPLVNTVFHIRVPQKERNFLTG